VNHLTAEDRRWLDAAARYATPFLGTTGDSPTVAALVVAPQTQTLVARAVTAPNGRPHAETQAIEAAGFEAAGCTLYVTLEPCHHWSRTPPCVDAIIRAGIMRVVIGTADPDPRTAGSSVAQFESAGVETIVADHAPSRALHMGHAMRHEASRPFVTAVLTVSADDMVGVAGEGRAPLGGMAGAWLDLLRTRSNAVLIGGATARADDPALVVGLPGLAMRTPLRVVLAGAAGIDRKVNLIGGFSGHRTAIIAENDAPIDAPVSVQVMRVAGSDGRPDLQAALRALADRGIQNLLAESGPRLAAALLEADLVDRFVLIRQQRSIGHAGIAASADGGIEDVLDAAGLVAIEHQRLGDDALTVYERSARPD